MRGDGRIFLRYKTDDNPGVWYVSYYFNGQEIRESSNSSDRKDAEALLKQRRLEVGADKMRWKKFIPPSNNKILVKKLLENLERDLKIREVWESSRLSSPMKAVQSAFGMFPAVNVTNELIDRRIEDWQKPDDPQDKIANSTINKRLLVLGMAFRLANENNIISFSPKITHLDDYAPRQGFFEREDFQKLLPNLPDDLKDFCLFGYLTGWRKSEISTLTWNEVDTKAKVIHLRAERSKNGESRIMPFFDELEEIITRRLTKKDIIVTSKATRLNPNSHLVFHRFGKPIQDFRKVWTAACEKAGIGKKLFHDFRRTAIKNMSDCGIPDKVGMEISGHKSRSVYDRYRIVSEKNIREAGGLISKAYKRGVGGE